MAEPVTLAEIKVHLRLDAGVSGEDSYLDGLIVAARRSVELRTSRSIVAEEPTLIGDDLVSARQAMLLMVANWYLNREGDAREPPQIAWLLEPITRWDDGA